MSASVSPISSPDETNDLLVAELLKKVANILSELSGTCSDLQDLQSYSTGVTLDTEQVIRGQALDRVTQTLQCLSDLNEALSTTQELKGASVSSEVAKAVKLPSIREQIECSGDVLQSQPVDIDLF